MWRQIVLWAWRANSSGWPTFCQDDLLCCGPTAQTWSPFLPFRLKDGQQECAWGSLPARHLAGDWKLSDLVHVFDSGIPKGGREVHHWHRKQPFNHFWQVQGVCWLRRVGAGGGRILLPLKCCHSPLHFLHSHTVLDILSSAQRLNHTDKSLFFLLYFDPFSLLFTLSAWKYYGMTYFF